MRKSAAKWQVGVHASAARALLSRLAAAPGSVLDQPKLYMRRSCALGQ